MDKKWMWVEPSQAADFARARDALTEALRIGHGFLDHLQFVHLLQLGELQIIAFPNKTAALVTCGDSAEGRVLNILTVQGNIKECEESIPYLEDAARETGCKLIISIGSAGWARVMKRQGYDIQKRLLMRKVLHD